MGSKSEEEGDKLINWQNYPELVDRLTKISFLSSFQLIEWDGSLRLMSISKCESYIEKN